MSLGRPSKNVFIQVLWNGVDGCIPTLYIFTDTKRYLFNCGEGLQRLFTQRKFKYGKLDTFFLTRYQWSHMGGLPGFAMTLRDMRNDLPYKERLKNIAGPIKSNSESKVPVGDEEFSISSNENSILGDEESSIYSNENSILGDEESSISSNQNSILEESSISSNENNILVPSEESVVSSSKVEDQEPEEHNEANQNVKNEPRKINIFAPEGMKKIITATQSFLHFDHTDVNFEVNEHIWEDRLKLKTYTDDELTVHSIPIFTDIKTTKPSMPHCEDGNFKSKDLAPHSAPSSLCFACQLKALPGKFHVQNAKKLGVPKGPLYGMLQRGETIVLDDGRTVTPDEVLGPGIPGPIFLIIDCPSKHYIESLMENTNMQMYLFGDETAQLVIHLSPEEVCADNSYLEWTKKFPTSTKHVFLCKLLQDCVVFESQHCLQFMLNRIDSKMFPLTEEHKKINRVKESSKDVPTNFMKINLRELMNPKKIFDYSEVKSKIDRSELVERVGKALQSNDVGQSVDDISISNKNNTINMNGKRNCGDDSTLIPYKKRNLSDPEVSGSKSGNILLMYPKIITLGTGASLPSKYRNVSGTLIFLSEDDVVLLDCGEGTYGELIRHYGDSVHGILTKIRYIFASHMHADHHLGLIMLIKKLNELQEPSNDSFVIMAPGLLIHWLTEYAGISESLRFKYITCKDAYKEIPILQNLKVQAVKVEHPGIAYGVVLHYNNDVKITYSGDTMPCDALIDAGRNSTLLIHEATLEDDMLEDARDRKHSTTTQAIEVAQRMNAEFVLLTHFSQRYPKLPIVKTDFGSSKIAYAFDHMEVTYDDIPKFHALVPTLNALFATEVEEDGGK